MQLLFGAAGRAAGSPTMPPQQAQAAEPEAKPDEPETKPDEPAAAEPEAPGTRNLDLTPGQCEALALGKPVKDVPAEARVEAVTFTEPPPITLQLPTQSREAVTECSLRASGLTVRFDKTRKVITLLPSGTRSPELPNPTIKVTLKFAEEGAKPEPP